MTPEGKCEVCGLCAEDRDLHIHQLHEKVKRLEKENTAFVEELKCYHDESDGDDTHWCTKCDSRVAGAEEIRATLDAAKEVGK